ncbi:MAG: hypothetical protein ACK4TA_03255 [Saprospiraceae bacterium]
MKKILVLLLGASMTLLTGCFDIVEEVFLNKDGSGKYHITMDMSGLFTDPMMKGMMEQTLREQAGGDAQLALEKDSVIYFKDLPEAAELSGEDKKTLENMLIRMTMSESKKQMLIRIEYDFKKIDDINKMNKVLAKVGADQQLGGGMPGGGLMSGEAANFSWKKGLLKRLPVEIKAPAEMDENMEMMKMFLGSANYKTIYHLPGKAKKVTIPNATVDGNTVTVENGMLEVMDGKAKLDGEIKFK